MKRVDLHDESPLGEKVDLSHGLRSIQQEEKYRWRSSVDHQIVLPGAYAQGEGEIGGGPALGRFGGMGQKVGGNRGENGEVKGEWRGSKRTI